MTTRRVITATPGDLLAVREPSRQPVRDSVRSPARAERCRGAFGTSRAPPAAVSGRSGAVQSPMVGTHDDGFHAVNPVTLGAMGPCGSETAMLSTPSS